MNLIPRMPHFRSPIERQADAAYSRVTGDMPFVLVMPRGWCAHLFAPIDRRDTFLRRCSDTGLFPGFDIECRGWRLVVCRINHLDRSVVIGMIDRERNDHDGHPAV